MLLNEFLKEHKDVEELEARLARIEKALGQEKSGVVPASFEVE